MSWWSSKKPTEDEGDRTHSDLAATKTPNHPMPPGHTPAPKVAHPATPPVLPQELQDLLASLARRLRDLESFQVPQLATCRGPLSLQEQFANDVRREMVGARRDLEVRLAFADRPSCELLTDTLGWFGRWQELKLQVDDLDKAKDRAAGMEQVRAVQARIESCVFLPPLPGRTSS